MVNDKFLPHKMNGEALQVCDEIREKASELDNLINSLPNSREKSLAGTKLEESVMWAIKSVALNGTK